VRWDRSFLALDGRAMICAFAAPDMESARLAMRAPGRDLSRFWPGTVIAGAPGIAPNVVVERSFEAPVRVAELEALVEPNTGCMETYAVKHAHSVVALDGRRLLSFYSAGDIEAVRRVQSEIGASFSAIWAGASLGPARSPG
jgi:hypothetical protein